VEEITEMKALKEGSLIGHKILNRARSTISMVFTCINLFVYSCIA
jgi:hypothetical protein